MLMYVGSGGVFHRCIAFFRRAHGGRSGLVTGALPQPAVPGWPPGAILAFVLFQPFHGLDAAAVFLARVDAVAASLMPRLAHDAAVMPLIGEHEGDLG